MSASGLGFGTALTLLMIDLIYMPAGRIRPTYLIDAAMEIGWIVAWARTSRAHPTSIRLSTNTKQHHVRWPKTAGERRRM